MAVQVAPAIGDRAPLPVLAQAHIVDDDVQMQVRVARLPVTHRAGGAVLDRPAEPAPRREAHGLAVLAADRVPDPPLQRT